MVKRLKFEMDTDGKKRHEFDGPETEVPGFDPNNPGATVGKIDDEVRIYHSQKNPKCVTIYINGRAYQV